MTSTDRGRAKHDVIAAAAGELLLEYGLGGISHRAVAHLAGVPLGSTTYHFASLDELRAAAVAQAAATDGARARSAADGPRVRSNRALAQRLLDVVCGLERLADPPAVAAVYERTIEASRTPVVADAARRWLGHLTTSVAAVVEQHRLELPAHLILALLDGRVIAWLATDDDVDVLVATVASDLRRLRA